MIRINIKFGELPQSKWYNQLPNAVTTEKLKDFGGGCCELLMLDESLFIVKRGLCAECLN